MGMSVPRPPIQLVVTSADLRLRTVAAPHHEFNPAAERFYRDSRPVIEGLDGYLFMARSPSCGLHSVKLHRQDGTLLNRKGRGLYAAYVQNNHPGLALVQSDDFDHPDIRDRFLTQLFGLAQLPRFSPPIDSPAIESFRRAHHRLAPILRLRGRGAQQKLLLDLKAVLAGQSEDERLRGMAEYRSGLIRALSAPNSPLQAGLLVRRYQSLALSRRRAQGALQGTVLQQFETLRKAVQGRLRRGRRVPPSLHLALFPYPPELRYSGR